VAKTLYRLPTTIDLIRALQATRNLFQELDCQLQNLNELHQKQFHEHK